MSMVVMALTLNLLWIENIPECLTIKVSQYIILILSLYIHIHTIIHHRDSPSHCHQKLNCPATPYNTSGHQNPVFSFLLTCLSHSMDQSEVTFRGDKQSQLWEIAHTFTYITKSCSLKMNCPAKWTRQAFWTLIWSLILIFHIAGRLGHDCIWTHLL